jgi:hypothetical protein
MKLIPAVCIFLLTLSVSCKKSNDQPGTPPSITDTTKPPVVKVDTSTLLKSMLDYSYDASGTTIKDSTLMEWKYDDQRRIVQQITKFDTHIDTLFYNYLNDGYTTDVRTYIGGSLQGVIHTVYYQHLQNRTDSVITNSGYRTYFYYSQAGQDSLEIQWFATNQMPLVQVNYYYTGQNLDSSIIRDDGILSSIGYYTNGNMSEYDLYTLDANNVLEITNHITYTNIPVGGLNVYFSGTTLRSGSTVFRIDSGTSAVETDSYQLDAANRVTLWIVNNNQPDFKKYLLTWY